ncbi:MAG TPA: flagellar basal body L-ring protein FlgH [Verrucomicrobiae bacterium]|nr:flagellar basal body L-ring protein FlgH [Verrucomicrobiae bacterium]
MSRRYWSCFKFALLLIAPCLSSHAQSLWKEDASRSMISDKRANSLGDILTILVQENNSASKDNSTQTSKKSSIDAAVEAFLYSPEASKLLTHNGKMPAMKMAGKQDFAGAGKISNNEKVTARIAVRVVDVLPNRNLVIEGTRQIAFSGETQDAVLRGVVRVEDIAANNTIFSYNIADATIKYISKGTVSDNQRKGWFSKIWEKVTPF